MGEQIFKPLPPTDENPYPCDICSVGWINISNADILPTKACFDSCEILKTYQEKLKVGGLR